MNGKTDFGRIYALQLGIMGKNRGCRYASSIESGLRIFRGSFLCLRFELALGNFNLLNFSRQRLGDFRVLQRLLNFRIKAKSNGRRGFGLVGRQSRFGLGLGLLNVVGAVRANVTLSDGIDFRCERIGSLLHLGDDFSLPLL